MKKIKVKIPTVNDAVLFVAKCNEYKKYDCDYVCGRYIIDSKSLMGVLSVGLDRECEVIFHCDDNGLCEKFENDIKLWEKTCNNKGENE